MMNWRIKSLFILLFAAYVSQEGQVYNSEENQNFILSEEAILSETQSASHTQCIHRCRLRSQCKQSLFSKSKGMCIMLRTNADIDTEIEEGKDVRRRASYQIATPLEFKG